MNSELRVQEEIVEIVEVDNVPSVGKMSKSPPSKAGLSFQKATSDAIIAIEKD